MERKIKSKIAQLSYDEKESILHVEIEEDADMSLEILKEHYSTIERITNGQSYFALINAQNLYTIEWDGLEYSSRKEAFGNRLAAAYCSPPLANRLNINYLKLVHNIAIPINIFPTRQLWLSWLNELRCKAKQ